MAIIMDCPQLLCQRRVGTVAIFMYCCLDSGKIFMYYGWACLEVPYWSLEQTTQNQTELGGEPRPGWGQTATEMTHHRLNQPLYRMFCRYAINIINNADGVTVTASLPCVVIRILILLCMAAMVTSFLTIRNIMSIWLTSYDYNPGFYI